MSRAFRLSMLGLLALALAGCFVSKTALIQPEQAERLFDGKTAYSLSTSKDGGKTWVEQETGKIGASGDGYVLNDEADTAFVLRKAFDGYYIAQQADKGEFYYDLLRIEGDHVYAYRFSCGDEDQRHVNAGLIDSLTGQAGDLHCEVSDFGKLAKVFAARLEAGALPKSLYIIR